MIVDFAVRNSSRTHLFPLAYAKRTEEEDGVFTASGHFVTGFVLFVNFLKLLPEIIFLATFGPKISIYTIDDHT